MTLIVTITENDIFKAMGDFLRSFVAPNVFVFKTQVNRVPEPKNSNFIGMTPGDRTRLSTNTHEYDVLHQKKAITQSTQYSIRLDVHGPDSGNNAQMIETLFRDQYAIDEFKKGQLGITPLYCSDARQTPFINAEDQYETVWMIQAELQFKPSVINDQQFFTSVDINLIDVDVEYPPV